MNENVNQAVKNPSKIGWIAIFIGIIGMVSNVLSYPIMLISYGLFWILWIITPVVCGIIAMFLGGIALKRAKKMHREKKLASIGFFTGAFCWILFPIISM